MANAMLEEGFKDSHPDLVAIEKDQTTTRNLVEDEPMKHHTTESKLPALQPPPPPSPKKSVDFSLEPPLKKAKTSDPWTAKQVVDGEYLMRFIRPSSNLSARLTDCVTHNHCVLFLPCRSLHSNQHLHLTTRATGSDSKGSRYL